MRYRTPDRRQTDKRGFTTKRDALLFAAKIEADKAAGAFVPSSAGQMTVSELADTWLQKKHRSAAPSHYRTLESSWRTKVAPSWGTRRIADVTTHEVEAWIADLVGNGSGTTTVRRAHSVLAGILGDAVKARRLTANPARDVENLPRRVSRRHTYLTAAEVHRLADQAAGYRTLVLILAFCGLRWSEAIALRVGDVEFLRRRLTISANAVEFDGSHYVGPTKGRRPRAVPVPCFVLNELSRTCEGKSRSELVFPSRSGGYLRRPHSSDGWFAGALRRASLEPMAIHDLRHSCAALAVSAGANVLALQRMLGHTSAKVTLDVYAELFDSDLDSLASSLDIAYAPGAIRVAS
ncbi:tyrosine-type recombinase/integrase [uncultured Mycolicibacterium sp.]|uniref:tyrosine-type recombinase/integrase n=1 Tax=uncultured Mycolicibacterium sp. TaxID=2320817 RepID=UPI0032B13D56